MTAPITKEQWAELRRESTEVLPGLVEQVGLPNMLLPYQADAVGLLDNVSTHVLFVEKSRRIGLTWGLASYAGLKAAKMKSAGGMDVMYISYSQEMTREFIDAVAMWLRAFNIAAREAEEFLFDDGDADGDRSIKAFRIQLASGFEILALSSAPRGLRGKQGVVIIDEAAFVDDLKELLKAALAFLMWGGQVVVCSTHNGAENEFNVVIQDILAGRRPYNHMRIDFDTALQQGLYQRICLVKGDEWSPEKEAEWRQSIIDLYGDGADEELFCIPSMGSGAWLTTPLIEARMTLTPEEAPILRLDLPPDYLHLPELTRRSLIAPFMDELASVLKTLDLSLRYAFGFDFARVADLSVAKLLGITQTLKRRSALTVEMRGVPGDEQIAIVADILEAVRGRLARGAFDATGMGWIVAEAMGRKFGLYDAKENETGAIEAVKFSQDWYRFEMPPLKGRFEENAIALAKDADHVSDLRAVKVVAGIPMVPAVRTNEKADGGKAGKKRHGDFAIALALADYASRQAWVEYAYTAVQDSRIADAMPPDRMFEYPNATDDDRPQRGYWASPLGARINGGI